MSFYTSQTEPFGTRKKAETERLTRRIRQFGNLVNLAHQKLTLLREMHDDKEEICNLSANDDTLSDQRLEELRKQFEHEKQLNQSLDVQKVRILKKKVSVRKKIKKMRSKFTLQLRKYHEHIIQA